MMQAYISGALMGSTNLVDARRRYELLAGACHRAGWEAYLPHLKTDPKLAPDLTDHSVATQDVSRLTRSDIVVAYLGEPSLGVGAEIAIAIQHKKPILAVNESWKSVSRFVKGLLQSYPEAALYEYETIEEACDWLEMSLRQVSEDVAEWEPDIKETL